MNLPYFDPHRSFYSGFTIPRISMDQKKRSFEPGEFVALFTGQMGMVLSEEMYQAAIKALKQGHKPGRYFAPGCCQHPDYIIQVPVIFEDGTYDVMRAMNLKRPTNVPEEKKKKIESIISRNKLS